MNGGWVGLIVLMIFFMIVVGFALREVVNKVEKLQTEHDSLWEWVNHFATITEEDAAQPGDDHE